MDKQLTPDLVNQGRNKYYNRIDRREAEQEDMEQSGNVRKNIINLNLLLIILTKFHTISQLYL